MHPCLPDTIFIFRISHPPFCPPHPHKLHWASDLGNKSTFLGLKMSAYPNSREHGWSHPCTFRDGWVNSFHPHTKLLSPVLINMVVRVGFLSQLLHLLRTMHKAWEGGSITVLLSHHCTDTDFPRNQHMLSSTAVHRCYLLLGQLVSILHFHHQLHCHRTGYSLSTLKVISRASPLSCPPPFLHIPRLAQKFSGLACQETQGRESPGMFYYYYFIIA